MTNRNDEYVDIGAGLFFVVATVAIYVPQHVKCISTKRSDGLSVIMILITTVSSVALLLATVLHDKHAVLHASSAMDCLNQLLPSLQNLLNLVVGIPSYLVYCYLYADDETRQRRHVWLSVATWMALLLTMVYGFILCLNNDDHNTQQATIMLVECFGLIASFTNLIQWLPQIYTTWQLQKVGALSMSTMVLSVVGDLLIFLYWWNLGESFFILLVLIADAISQGILIGLIVYFTMRDSQRFSITSNQELQEPLLFLLSQQESSDGSAIDDADDPTTTQEEAGAAPPAESEV